MMQRASSGKTLSFAGGRETKDAAGPGSEAAIIPSFEELTACGPLDHAIGVVCRLSAGLERRSARLVREGERFLIQSDSELAALGLTFPGMF